MEGKLHDRIEELQERLRTGSLSRRDFLRYATLLGVSLGAAEALAACAAPPTPTPVPPVPTTKPVAAATAIPCPTAVPPVPCPTAVPPEPCPECPECPECPTVEAPVGWGRELWSYPNGAAFIEPVEQNCVGCGACEMACSMKHFGVINKDWARVHVAKFMLPLPKAIQVTCVQCQAEERECEKACPIKPAAITYDSKTRHMVVNTQTCAGKACLACTKACPSGAVKFVEAASDVVFVCDMCDIGNTGARKPECVDVCQYNALRIRNNTPADNWRLSMDEKAELLARRLYPLANTEMANPGWRM
jgi:carbon-monoxide dehydrogenase iron sulfur subunit